MIINKLKTQLRQGWAGYPAGYQYYNYPAGYPTYIWTFGRKYRHTD